MTFPDLRGFLHHLESCGELIRVPVEVDPDQEVTILQHKVLAAGGPALLFEHVKGSSFPMVTNLFGTPSRVEAVFGKPPEQVGAELASLADQLMPPTVGQLWKQRGTLMGLRHARLARKRSGPVFDQSHEPPNLKQLPVLTCWPLDGGPFFTLPLIHTTDPVTGRGNLGIYRMQRFCETTTGMHWQIEKGGGFHFAEACRLKQSLPVTVILGGPPALTLAAIAPLPEGVDERLLAAYLMQSPLSVAYRPESGHLVPVEAEFILEGSVSPGDQQQEGPFGDHLGHYSHSAPFPVFRVKRMLSRKNAIYPATVVGKPPQEDYYIGCALQEMGIPLLKLMDRGLCDLWAYPETGFHPLAVAAVKSRYPRESLKHAFGLLGQGQLSLTKVTIIVGESVAVRDFQAVSNALYQHLDAEEGIHLIAPTAQDTLDFTGPAMNTGSRLILLATGVEPLRHAPPPPPPPAGQVESSITGMVPLGPAILAVQVKADADRARIIEALQTHPITSQYLFHVLLSEDVPLDNQQMILWGWFTRFDPLKDLHPKKRTAQGNRLVLHFPITIDATWKEGYRQPVECDLDKEREVEARWSNYGISL